MSSLLIVVVASITCNFLTVEGLTCYECTGCFTPLSNTTTKTGCQVCRTEYDTEGGASIKRTCVESTSNFNCNNRNENGKVVFEDCMCSDRDLCNDEVFDNDDVPTEGGLVCYECTDCFTTPSDTSTKSGCEACRTEYDTDGGPSIKRSCVESATSFNCNNRNENGKVVYEDCMCSDRNLCNDKSFNNDVVTEEGLVCYECTGCFTPPSNTSTKSGCVACRTEYDTDGGASIERSCVVSTQSFDCNDRELNGKLIYEDCMCNKRNLCNDKTYDDDDNGDDDNKAAVMGIRILYLSVLYMIGKLVI